MKKFINIITKSAIKTTAYIFAFVVLFAGLATTISAVTWTEGVSPGGGGGTGTGVWQLVTTSGSQTAWQKWVSIVRSPLSPYGLYGESGVTNWMKNSGMFGSSKGQEIINYCKTSKAIWYYSMGSSGTQPQQWSSLSRNTNRAILHASQKGDKTTKVVVDGITVSVSTIWDIYTSESASWSGGYVVLVCSDMPIGGESLEQKAKPVTTQTSSTTTETEYRWRDDAVQIASGTYSNATTVQPVNISGLTSFNGVAVSQTSGEKLTAFGTWYENNKSRLNALQSLTGTAYQNELNALKASAASVLSGNYKSAQNVNLNATNQQALESGGIFTVTESERNYTISAPLQMQQKRTRSKTVTTYTTTYADGTKTTSTATSYGNWSSWADTGTMQPRSVLNQTYGTLTAVSYYQIMGVRCNVTAFNNVISASGSRNASSGDSYGVAISPKVTNVSQLPFGNANHSNSTLRQTATSAFFTSTASCEVFQCTPTPQTGAPANDSNNNVLTDPEKVAQYREGTTAVAFSDIFQFFRDNEPKSVRVNIWYPVISSPTQDITIDSRAAATTTYLTQASGGTPVGDVFTLRNGKNNAVIANGDAKTSTIAGQVNLFTAAASWASDENKPQRFSIAWKYEADINSKIPSTVNSSGVVTYVTTAIDVDVFCSLQANNAGNYKATITLNDSVPSNLLTYRSASGQNFGFLFVRAVAE